MPDTFTTRAPVYGQRGVIATSNYLATTAGMNILRRPAPVWHPPGVCILIILSDRII